LFQKQNFIKHPSERIDVSMKTARKLIAILLIVTLFTSFFTFSAATHHCEFAFGGATVNTDALNIRTGPSTNHNIVTVVSRNTVIVVYERANPEWLKINYHGNVGYVACEFLRDILPARNFAALGLVEGFLVNVRARPYTSSGVLMVVGENTNVDVIGINNGWFKIQHGGHTGYIRSDFMRVVGGPRPGVLPAHSGGAASSAVPVVSTASAAPVHSNAPLGRQIADFARTLHGYRYVWGGTTRAGFDCSGFVVYVMNNFGISVRRVANDQFNNSGNRIARSDLAPGDLVFFSRNGGGYIHHVGIYIGNNEMIHASSPSTGVIITRIDSPGRINTFAGANRVV
jgi:cell wall-associated NlpC family hydrolase